MIHPEEEIKNKLPIGMQQIAQIDMTYQKELQVVESNLKRIYGKRADWKTCLKSYRGSTEYSRECRLARKIEDIPVISTDQLYQMISEEDEAQRSIQELMQLQEAVRQANSRQPSTKETLRAAEILGILPGKSKKSLYQ